MARVPLLLLCALALLGGACAWHAQERGLCREHELRTRPFPQSRTAPGDVEQVVYVPEEDSLWLADDGSHQLYILDRATGSLRARLRERDFLKALPEAALCDDEDGNPDTSCSHTAELEGLAYDQGSLTLYVLNTVNDIHRRPPIDKSALFVLRKPAPTANFDFVGWREMPGGQDFKYTALAAIDGKLYVSVFDHVYAWDLEANRFAETDAGGKPVAAFTSPHGTIVGMAWDRAVLWVLSADKMLSKVDWSTRQEVETWDLSAFGISKAKGLAVAPEEFFVVDGDPPTPIHVLGFHRAPRMSRAGFLGGWPQSCE
jgi:hypothetical protein